MKIFSKKIAILTAVLSLSLSSNFVAPVYAEQKANFNPFSFFSIFKTNTNPPKKDNRQNKQALKKTPVKKGKVQPISKNGKVLGAVFSPVTFINCAMPDGKTIKASKIDCDAVNAFWASHQPSNPGSGGGGGNSGGGSNNNSGGSNNNNNNSGNPQPTATDTPKTEKVTVLPCTSSSCAGITTLIVEGKNFPLDGQVGIRGMKINNLGNPQFNYDTQYSSQGQVVNRVGTSKITADFYNVGCDTYILNVYSTTSSKVAPYFIVDLTPYTCN